MHSMILSLKQYSCSRPALLSTKQLQVWLVQQNQSFQQKWIKSSYCAVSAVQDAGWFTCCRFLTSDRACP